MVRKTLNKVLLCVTICAITVLSWFCIFLSTLLFLHCALRAHVKCKRLINTLHYTLPSSITRRIEAVARRQHERTVTTDSLIQFMGRYTCDRGPWEHVASSIWSNERAKRPTAQKARSKMCLITEIDHYSFRKGLSQRQNQSFR